MIGRRSVASLLVFAVTIPAWVGVIDLSDGSALAASCTPGYRPCIPLKASDVDCHGGSGNGPRYTKRNVVYRVTGSDRYRLDADRDGWGCER